MQVIPAATSRSQTSQSRSCGNRHHADVRHAASGHGLQLIHRLDADLADEVTGEAGVGIEKRQDAEAAAGETGVRRQGSAEVAGAHDQDGGVRGQTQPREIW